MSSVPDQEQIENFEQSAPWIALFWVVVFGFILVALVVLGLLYARARQIDKVLLKHPKTLSYVVSESLEVDFSGQGALLVEYGGGASISPEIEPSSDGAGDTALTARSESADQTEPLEDISEPESLGEPDDSELSAPDAPVIALPQRFVADPKVPSPARTSGKPPVGKFLVAPPALKSEPNSKPAVPEVAAASELVPGGNYQVLVGPFGPGADVTKIESSLKEHGLEVRQQLRNGTQYLLVGKTQNTQKEALSLADEVARLGHEVMVRKTD